MAQMLSPMQAKRNNVQTLLTELQRVSNCSAKEIQRYLERKDALIGGGNHHRKRGVTLGQIRSDLQSWLDNPNHN